MIPSSLTNRLVSDLESRRKDGLLRSLPAWDNGPGWINLADNDYLELSRDPAITAAARAAAIRHGCSSSASPLISGYQSPHRDLEAALCSWHGFPSGLVWNSGYSANRASLSSLARKGDIIFADRLVHNSVIGGILQSGARLIRYRHNDLEHLGDLLRRHNPLEGCTRFVVTESVFSMDGDSPDLAALGHLKQALSFCLILDEAHAIGWYGPNGQGLASQAGETVDVLVGTCGKALGSQGAYTLFRDPALREFLINFSPEFIYSTYLSPIAVAATLAAIQRSRELAPRQKEWHDTSRRFRAILQEDGWAVPDGDSPIVPVIAGGPDEALSLGSFLRENKIFAGVVRPPTVPAGSSRIRFSLKRGFTLETAERIRRLLRNWKETNQ